MSTSRQPAENKRKVDLISSDSEDEKPINKENLEKSLTNLQINMRELTEKIDYMMIAFQEFQVEFKTNHMVLMEDVKGFKKEAKRLADGVCVTNARNP